MKRHDELELICDSVAPVVISMVRRAHRYTSLVTRGCMGAEIPDVYMSGECPRLRPIQSGDLECCKKLGKSIVLMLYIFVLCLGDLSISV